MICGIGDGGFRPVEPAARGDICFDAEDWLDVGGYCLCIELDGTEHIAVVGNGYSIHLQLLAAFEQFVEGYCAIEQ